MPYPSFLVIAVAFAFVVIEELPFVPFVIVFKSVSSIHTIAAFEELITTFFHLSNSNRILQHIYCFIVVSRLILFEQNCF